MMEDSNILDLVLERMNRFRKDHFEGVSYVIVNYHTYITLIDEAENSLTVIYDGGKIHGVFLQGKEILKRSNYKKEISIEVI